MVGNQRHRGGASATIIGLHTRRHHGLLTAATTPPVGRSLLLSRLEETIVIGETRIELAANQYPGVIHPQGYRYARQFRLDPFPIFTYALARELLTPCGLRSSAPSHPHYRGRYEGDPSSRDSTYHQGTVWPWLLGPFITAYLKVHGGIDDARQQALAWLAPPRHHLEDRGVGQVSEIFDGDAPHQPRGCIAEAWSVAELLRVLVQDVWQPHSLSVRT